MSVIAFHLFLFNLSKAKNLFSMRTLFYVWFSEGDVSVVKRFKFELLFSGTPLLHSAIQGVTNNLLTKITLLFQRGDLVFYIYLIAAINSMNKACSTDKKYLLSLDLNEYQVVIAQWLARRLATGEVPGSNTSKG